ncbi:MAG: hypothetical protein ACOYUK_01655 [Patescibacteria group bacterium]
MDHSPSFWQIVAVCAVMLIAVIGPLFKVQLIRHAYYLAIKRERKERANAAPKPADPTAI